MNNANRFTTITWNNTLYQRNEGALFANQRAMLIGAVQMSKEDNDFLFRNRIVFKDDEEEENKKVISTLIKGVIKKEFSFYGFKNLVKGFINGSKLEKLYKKYNANDGDFEEISKFNQAAERLSKLGFIRSVKETFGTQIQCIFLVDECIQEAEQYLVEKCGYVSKDMQIEKLRNLVGKYKNASPICEKECARLLESIAERKVPKNIDELDDVLKAIAFIENNQEELYMREMSMKVYGDSKYFENVSLQPVCSMLRKYSKQNLLTLGFKNLQKNYCQQDLNVQNAVKLVIVKKDYQENKKS